MSKPTQSIVVEPEYRNICFFCGDTRECQHHLLFGRGIKDLAEEDGLKVPCCNNCHNMSEVSRRIHDNSMAENLSKKLGQAIYEQKIGSREEFRRRYGQSYL